MHLYHPDLLPISTIAAAIAIAAQSWRNSPPPPLHNPKVIEMSGTARVLGRQANLKESSKSKVLAEMRLQVLVVVITSDACESKKEIMRLRE